MARTYFSVVLRKSSEITNNKPIFIHYNIFYNYEYFLFQSAFWSLLNHSQRNQSNQEQSSLCYSSPYSLVLLGLFCCAPTTRRCNAFQHTFVNYKKSEFLRSIFPDCVIYCEYDLTFISKILSFFLTFLSKPLFLKVNAIQKRKTLVIIWTNDKFTLVTLKRYLS